MNKPILFFVLRQACLLGAAVASFIAYPASAQGPIALETLQIELWPEFDKPATLVVITATLAQGVTLPAELTVRIPAASGGPYAVAARDANGDLINAPFTTAPSGDDLLVRLQTDQANFRVEYYDPGLAVGGAFRDFTFNWQADYAARSATIRVQEPFGAEGMSFDPPLTLDGAGDFGLNYYSAALGPVTAGQVLTLRLTYSKADSRLTADAVGVSGPVSPELPEPVKTSMPSPWLFAGLAAGVILIGAGVFWYVRGEKGSRRAPQAASRHHRRKRGTASGPADLSDAAPRPVVQTAAGFCHECGGRLIPGDRFCRNCGAGVR